MGDQDTHAKIDALGERFDKLEKKVECIADMKDDLTGIVDALGHLRWLISMVKWAAGVVLLLGGAWAVLGRLFHHKTGGG